LENIVTETPKIPPRYITGRVMPIGNDRQQSLLDLNHSLKDAAVAAPSR